MRLAIMETITTPGGHEVDFDRIIVEELKKLGHEIEFCVPQDFVFKIDYHVPVNRMPGRSISYTGVKGLKKLMYSVKREYNRQRWYRYMFEQAKKGCVDAIIVPTSTYRYLRALNINVLKHSPVPVIFVLHGINPGEAPKFMAAAEKLLPYPNIKMVVLTFQDHIFGKRLSNIYPIYPPTYTARDIFFQPEVRKKDVLRIGFFGQYRREKKLEDFLDVFIKGKYTRPLELLVQGSTMRPEDAADFERIQGKYGQHKHIKFLHKGLIGSEWQQAIADIDVLLMPYSAPRYRYHWGGMLFTAIGYQKPVIVSDDINPEVMEKYQIGESFSSGNLQDLQLALERFINQFDDKVHLYAKELQAASEAFSPEAFVTRLEHIIFNNKDEIGKREEN